MTKRIRVSHNDPFIKPAYTTWLSAFLKLTQTKDVYIIGGRATAKTSELIAGRSLDVMYDMPHSQQVFVSDTYQNAMQNIMPTLFEGWARKGWKIGRDYVVDERPPKHFKSCYKPTESFKHTVSTKVGVRIIIGSLDQPSSLAGNSFQHIYGDESRILKMMKLKRINPAVRGEYAQFGHSPFYRGRTFTTDMPNILSGDDDWILEMEKEMNLEQIRWALELGKKMNEIRMQMYNAQMDRKPREVELLQKQLVRVMEKWVRVRMNSTLFYVVSSFVNADVLQEGFFRDQLVNLGAEEFKTAILSMRPEIKAGEKFYTHLGEHHFFDDGVIKEYYDRFSLAETFDQSSQALRYIDHGQKLEAGLDYGDMCSLVIAQNRGNYMYLLKEFFTLAPENTKELAAQFRTFFKNHRYKVLDLYYDRSGNQFKSIKKDWASEFKNYLEFENGVSTGWVVNLMSEGQATIYHEQEYNFMRQILGEMDSRLPKIKIDQFQCRCLKSSLELSKLLVKTDNKGSRTIHKDKSSEKLPLKSRPLFSTNFSDAFKYLICRRTYMNTLRGNHVSHGFEPTWSS